MHVPDLLGQRYRLDERVDGGAMGEVWKGEDTRLNRTVAVKVLHASLSTSPAFKQRFAAEARAAAALRAPGIVDLYDYGEDTRDNGSTVSYLVMEFVHGRPLSRVLAEDGRMQPGDVMAIMARAAVALDAAHRAGVIHRDVKPGNILLREDGSIKVVDFGIARANGESGLTATGQVMGTVAYVSPEQLYDEELTGASDIYSLGVVGYECLAGRKPFNADVPAAVINAALHQDPPPLPDDVPAEVSGIIMRCLKKEAHERWPDGVTLARECRSVAKRLPQGDSTEALAVPTIDEELDDQELRPAAPAHDGDTRDFPVSDAPLGRAVPPAESPEAEERDGRKRKKYVTVAAALLLLVGLLGTTAAIRPWESWAAGGDEKGNQESVVRQPASMLQGGQHPESDDDWGQYPQDPTGSDPEPSESENPSDDPTQSQDPTEPEEPTDTEEPTGSDDPTEPDVPSDVPSEPSNGDGSDSQVLGSGQG
ncbi:MAG TPA: serine/threonine protein kinase [Candidatus Stackebrandtia faecavium]|nr:serine/threonine protein kinase [Candidatus Stackebrandtia faecavium]